MAKTAMTDVQSSRRTRAVGIVLPVHNEERMLRSSLNALDAAASLLGDDFPSHIVIVLDNCRDDSATVARRWIKNRAAGRKGRSVLSKPVTVLTIDAGNVGSARRVGCAFALHSFRGTPADNIWLATTDADSTVPVHWLVQQVTKHDLGVDIWSGSVTVLDWIQRQSGTAGAWGEKYGAERHWAHGASLGVNGRIYLGVGGFEDLASGEDRSLLEAAAGIGARTYYDRSTPVTTSARRNGRAPLGFAHALSRIEEDLAASSSAPTNRLATH
jgi:glycosyltransferase involved in cell wall biosynthesis